MPNETAAAAVVMIITASTVVTIVSLSSMLIYVRNHPWCHGEVQVYSLGIGTLAEIVCTRTATLTS